MFCKYCGNEIADDSVFCSKCGKNVKEGRANPSSPAKNAAAGENTANENDAVEKRGSAPKEERASSDSSAKDTAAGENVAGEQSGARKEEITDFAAQAKNAADEKDTANKQDGETASKTTDETVEQTVDSVSDSIENTNPLCIAGLVLAFLMLFFNTYGIVGFAALCVSFFGYKAAGKNGQKGKALAIVCMAVAGIVSFIFIIRLIEYQRYESAVYGELNGVLEWLGDL